MVYSKKTWVSNEVITTAALNNIESGVENAYKTSEMIGDGALDMDSNPINNVSALDVDSVFDTTASGVAVPSQTLQYSKDTEAPILLSAGSFVEVQSVTLGATHVGSSNGFLVLGEVNSNEVGTEIELRANGVVIGTRESTTTYQGIGGFALALAQGDKITVNMKSTGAAVGYIKNFRLYADYVVKTVGVDGGSFS